MYVLMYEAKKTMSALVLEYIKIHACPYDVYFIKSSMKVFLIVLHEVNLSGRKKMAVLLLIRRGFLQKCYRIFFLYLDLSVCFNPHKLLKT